VFFKKIRKNPLCEGTDVDGINASLSCSYASSDFSRK